MFSINKKTVFDSMLSNREFLPAIGIILIAIGLSSVFWFSFSEYLIGSSASIGVVSARLTALLVLASLTGMLFASRAVLAIFSATVMLPACWFAPPSFFVAAFLFPAGILILGLDRIREENVSCIKLLPKRSMAWGAPYIVAAFSMSLAFFYFLTIQTLPIDAVLPKISFGEKTGGYLTKALVLVNPDFRSVDAGNLTVDEFLRATNEGSSEAFLGENQWSRGVVNGGMIDQGVDAGTVKKIQEEAILAAGRERFSKLLDAPLTGRERMSDVLSEIVNKKVEGFSAQSEAYGTLIPSVLAIVVFLTTYSTASLLAFAWILMAHLLFSLLRILRVVRITKIPAEREAVQFFCLGQSISSQSLPMDSGSPSSISNQES